MKSSSALPRACFCLFQLVFCSFRVVRILSRIVCCCQWLSWRKQHVVSARCCRVTASSAFPRRRVISSPSSSSLLAWGAVCIVFEWHAAVLVTPFVCTVFVVRCTGRLTSSIILKTCCSEVLSVFCFCLFSPSEWWDERWVKRTQSVPEQVRLGCQFLWVSGERATKHGFCAVFRWFLDPLMESAVPDTWLFPSRRRKYCDLDLVTVDFFLSVWLLAGKNLRLFGLDF